MEGRGYRRKREAKKERVSLVKSVKTICSLMRIFFVQFVSLVVSLSRRTSSRLVDLKTENRELLLGDGGV